MIDDDGWCMRMMKDDVWCTWYDDDAGDDNINTQSR